MVFLTFSEVCMLIRDFGAEINNSFFPSQTNALGRFLSMPIVTNICEKSMPMVTQIKL